MTKPTDKPNKPKPIEPAGPNDGGGTGNGPPPKP